MTKTICPECRRGKLVPHHTLDRCSNPNCGLVVCEACGVYGRDADHLVPQWTPLPKPETS